jgi:UDP-N-acetylglucosamine 3-dehydrogenase
MTNVAVIGAGNMGKNHVRTYSEMDGVKLVAIADVSETAKQLAEKHCCKFYSDYREMLENEKLDAVSVCVPTSLHYAVAKDVINKGVNLLIEKPITKKIDEGEEIVKLAKAKGIKLAIGHIERFNPAVRKLKEIVVQGKLGDITSIVARRVGLFPPQIKDANVVIDVAVHDIDVCNFIMDKKPDKIICESGRAIISHREDFADIFMKYGNSNAFIQVNWITPIKIRNLSVTGTKGYAELNYITQELTVYESNYEKQYSDFGDFVLKFGEPKKTVVDVVKAEPLKEELSHFINCVKTGSQPEVDGEAGLVVLRIALEAERVHNG